MRKLRISTGEKGIEVNTLEEMADFDGQEKDIQNSTTKVEGEDAALT